MQKISQPPIIKISLKITYLKFHSNLPGVNELNIHFSFQPSSHAMAAAGNEETMKDYFRSPAYLTVSGQLHLEAMARSALFVTVGNTG